eukprot:jgi/Botrbrau1/2669/Bobra.0203s0016.1
MLKSALTQSLRQDVDAANLEKEATDRLGALPPPVLDRFSFPCLANEEATEDVLQDIRNSVKNENPFLPGSAPTADLLPSGTPLADYSLNPYRRRGGEEHRPVQSFKDDMNRWKKLGRADLRHNFITDDVVGSLPHGLSLDDRRSLFESMPASPLVKNLQSVSEDLVRARTTDGKSLRRHVLSGSWLVFVTAGYSGKRFIFQKAKELGVKSIVLDGPDSWAQTMVDDGTIQKFIAIDFEDSGAVFDRCLEAIKRVIHEEGIQIDGILTFCEIAVPLASRLAEMLGLPGNRPEAVDNARDKSATRRIMEARGLPTPRNMLISDPEDIEKAGKHVGFPAVIKPIYGAASIGVVRVNSQEELEEKYKKVEKEMKAARIVAGALQQGNVDDDELPPDAPDGKAGWIKTTLMLEEYLDGPEVDVDLVFSESCPVFGAITDNWPTVEPYFNETGSNCPSILPTVQQRELITLAVQSVQCLGFELGVFHVELKYTSRGPRLIEVNCRMGGGPVRNTNLLVWGVDLVEEHLLTSAGIPTSPSVAPKPLMHIAEYSINADKSGYIQSIDFLKDWEDHDDVLYARPLVHVGEKVTGVNEGMPTWVAEIMVNAPTVEEAIDFVNSICDSIKLPIGPQKPVF